jgi:hypothetical protein
VALTAFPMLFASFAYASARKMEVICFSETSVNLSGLRDFVFPEDSTRYSYTESVKYSINETWDKQYLCTAYELLSTTQEKIVIPCDFKFHHNK